MTEAHPPIPMRWDGEAMVPLPRLAAEADRAFVIGQVYRMVEHLDRSMASHGHYFAELNEAWANLPDDLAALYPSAEHLRKAALIRTGHADSRQFVASSKAEALRLAAFMRPVDEYAIVSVAGATVTVWTARSQSMRAMGKRAFETSKADVLGYVAGLIGTTRPALAENARQSA